MKYIPNAITILRILLIIPIIWLIWEESYREALILVVIAGVSDGVDGFLARFFRWKTPSGAVLDPLADKILLVSLFIVFGMKHLIPLWLVVLVIMRDVIILGGALAYQLVTRNLQMHPLMVSKVNTFLQICLIVLVAFNLASVATPPWLFEGLIFAVMISTIVSGISYVILWSRYTRQSRQHVKQ